MILHICSRAEWASARESGRHVPAGFAVDGFVHCSDPGTVHLPANTLFRGRDDLLLLVIDPALLDAELRWEPGDPADPAGPWFPHVYGPIPVSAVVATHDFPPAEDGAFRLPNALARP
ncbi:Uncharacterized conserved protein, DUF952 family [Streptoalloteichus tenebrarius]|uniref:Uncharacterized conserved protein, DUF952 family n=1 Tax=Streptoalloteichus tenebrarius (strain ATCC 17920 / DSM 40477 / JCM 4838 / CBS 697.72 / NBRC 16177 / NCIMB 11028 / NRRL B-12390 / A12253. 1 / ISP 5477) TaxID=1933 RepID=A0ABT1HYB7_STRSD|nr:DUF952 domain-containing protein [Streptoalloteichus tenebrarius]MCP2260527.1 Uncharacterized conserved protein, DUF952 family [Streptoalloteichus tenebrarius]BFF01867.1 DUF952 domain-containing protein [Streptoalloteichus tenebrarius]